MSKFEDSNFIFHEKLNSHRKKARLLKWITSWWHHIGQWFRQIKQWWKCQGRSGSFSGSHLNKQLLQILLELLWVCGHVHRANLCVVGDVYHQRSRTETKLNQWTLEEMFGMLYNGACLDRSQPNGGLDLAWYYFGEVNRTTRLEQSCSLSAIQCEQRQSTYITKFLSKPQPNLSGPEKWSVAFVQDMNINLTQHRRGWISALTKCYGFILHKSLQSGQSSDRFLQL